MPHYYFHVRNDIDTDDLEGMDLADEATARRFAVDNARVLMCETLRQSGNINVSHSIIVAGEDRSELFTLTFREAMTITE